MGSTGRQAVALFQQGRRGGKKSSAGQADTSARLIAPAHTSTAAVTAQAKPHQRVPSGAVEMNTGELRRRPKAVVCLA